MDPKGGGMNWEIGIDMCILLCIKQIVSENALWSSENSAECSVET